MGSRSVGTGKTVTLSLKTSGIGNGSAADFEIFKVDGNESLDTVSGNVSEDKVEVEWTAKGPGADDEEQFWELYYKVKCGGLEAKCTDLVVFTDWVEVTSVDEEEASLPDAMFRLTVRGEARERNTGSSGVRKCEHLAGPGDVKIEWIPPYELIEWIDEEGPKRKAKVREVRPAKLVTPLAGEHVQYVNLEASEDAPEQGSKLKVKVTLVDAKAGAKGYARVVWGEENSKRNDPKPELVGGVQEDWCEEGGIEFTLQGDDGTADCEGTFDIELGLAGCDTVTLYVGGTKECKDEKVVIRTLRKIYHQVTRLAEAVLPGFEPALEVLQTVGIEYEEYNQVEVAEGDPPAGSIVEGVTVGVDGPALVIGDHNKDFFKGKFQDDKAPIGAHLIVCHAQYDGGSPAHEQTLEFETQLPEKTVNITDPELYDVFPMAIQDGNSCILAGSTWESTAPSGHADEGKSGELTGDDIDFTFETTPDRLRVILPDDAAEIVGPGVEEGAEEGAEETAKHPIKITLNVRVARGPFLGESDEVHQLIVQARNELRFNEILVHELGHAIKQCVDTPPGLSASDHGWLYEGKEHPGHHCGSGMSSSDFGGEDFREAGPGSCAMYGQGDGDTEPESGEFCRRCVPFVRAQDCLSLSGTGKMVWHRTADDIADEEAEKGRVVTVEAMTSKGHPILNVEATLTMEDGEEFKAKSDDQGLVEFTNVPEEAAGEITYADEDDLIARSFAANIKAAIDEGSEPLILQYLQAAVDFAAVKAVYQENYADEPGPLIKKAFTENDDVIEYLLVRSGLMETGLTVVKDEFGQS